MKMLVFQVTSEDGTRTAVVQWTEEFGFIQAGDTSLLDLVAYEVREPERIAPATPSFQVVPPKGGAVAQATFVGDNARAAGAEVEYLVDEPEDESGLTTMPCFTCGCLLADHAGGGCAKHDCKAFVP